ncbi:hypothetical protein COU14_01340 [Candidatus Kaiserbacteria bacterium CG10_big_fil_rev_8_21_14_0_10_44_10]|uniref:Septum formation initiator n=1 Tax=Candidatus Kaiserbacteria bacterium CG10_big_fil_rev_8_21_14_0_10_44_10 TaxID=1974606 RepID=A0A2H0UJM4_9BACT|nr:MAG: hypothetical protein COU14_01340 [Candidatus Kaiserbacteria bacterium CG10_big_fil_rev_8_21_14_0_10_44_10]
MGLLSKKSWWQSILSSRLTVVVLFIASFTLSFAVYDRYVVEQDVRERRHDAELELEELKAHQAELEERVDYLSNEQGLETEIRRHFDVSKEGEQVVVLMGETATLTPTVRIEQDTGVEDQGFWRNLIPW